MTRYDAEFRTSTQNSRLAHDDTTHEPKICVMQLRRFSVAAFWKTPHTDDRHKRKRLSRLSPEEALNSKTQDY